MHVELVGGRREAVGQSGGGRGAGQRDGQVRPGHGDGVVDVQVAAGTCTTSHIILAMNKDVVLGKRSEIAWGRETGLRASNGRSQGRRVGMVASTGSLAANGRSLRRSLNLANSRSLAARQSCWRFAL